jgi:hypothetical protein
MMATGPAVCRRCQLRHTSRHLGDDLRHFVEHGTSARKQRQVKRRRQP